MSTRELTEEELELGAVRALEPLHQVQRPSLMAVAQAIAAEYALPLEAVGAGFAVRLIVVNL